MKAAPALFRLTGIAVFIQLLLGGLLTFNFIPVLPHIVTGFAVLILAIAALVASFLGKPPFRPLRAVSIVMVLLLFLQIVLGFMALGSGGSLVALVHFVNALAIYGAAISGTFIAMRWDRMVRATETNRAPGESI